GFPPGLRTDRASASAPRSVPVSRRTPRRVSYLSQGRNRAMNRDPVLFRVDGTTELGWERLNRCLTYALALQRRRRPTYFLSRLEPATLAGNIKRVGNEWLEADAPIGSEEGRC